MVFSNFKEYINKEIEFFRQKVSGLTKIPKLLLVQVGENEYITNFFRIIKNVVERTGCECEWYFYPNEISNDKLKQEVEDLVPFADSMIVQPSTSDRVISQKIFAAIPQKKRYSLDDDERKYGLYGLHDYLENDLDFYDKNILIIGGAAKGEAIYNFFHYEPNAIAIHRGKKELEPFLQSADIIFSTTGELNCYSLHDKIIVDVGNWEWKPTTINIENRQVLSLEQVQELIGISVVVDMFYRMKKEMELEKQRVRIAERQAKWARIKNGGKSKCVDTEQ